MRLAGNVQSDFRCDRRAVRFGIISEVDSDRLCLITAIKLSAGISHAPTAHMNTINHRTRE
jgi:hypothetical protein